MGFLKNVVSKMPETLINSGKNRCSKYFHVLTTPYYNLLHF